MSRAFIIDTAVVAVTQLILRLRGLVLLPLIVTLLGTSAYGVWAQVVAFALFLTAIVSLNFHIPLVREIAADRTRASSVYTTLFLATIAISGAMAVVLALIPGPVAAALLDDRGAATFVQLALLLMLGSNVRMLNVSLYRATGRLAVRSAMELVAALGEVAGIVVILEGGGSLENVLVFMVAWNGGIAAVQTVHCFLVAGWSVPQWPIVTAAIAYAVPLLPASFANFALDRMDRFIIGHYRGAEGVGIYAANYAIAGLVMMGQTPFQMTLLPKVAELWEKQRPRAARYIEMSLMAFLTLAIPFVVGVPLVSERALIILGNAEIADDAALTTLLISAGVTMWGVALIQAQVFYGARRTGTWGAITTGATAVNFVVNIALVPWVGVVGAAAATLVSYLAVAVTSSWIGRSILRLHYDLRHLAACAIAAVAMGCFLFVMNPQDGPMLGASIAGAIAIYALVLFLLHARVPALRGTTVEGVLSSLRSFRR